nr:uncharacterized protein LOC128703531 [Cherax quadricarinatus]
MAQASRHGINTVCIELTSGAVTGPSMELLLPTIISDTYGIANEEICGLALIGVRVSAAAVSAAAVTSLPSTQERVELELTDVSDDIVSHACDLARELQPPGGYWRIECESSTVTVVGIQDMIHRLHHHSVKMKTVFEVITRGSITQYQWDQLVTLAKTTLNCRLYL